MDKIRVLNKKCMKKNGGVSYYMQHGKKLTREQRTLLIKNKLDAESYLYIKEVDKGSALLFQHRETGETVKVSKK